MNTCSQTFEDDLRALVQERDDVFEQALERALRHVAWPSTTPLPEELSPARRRLAEVLATRARIPGLSQIAIPKVVQFRRRWLGLEAPSALERRYPYTVDGTTVSWPLWRIWRVAGDEPDEGSGISAIVESRAELLDAYLDSLFWGPYPGIDDSAILKHIRRIDADLGDWATRRLDEIVGWAKGESVEADGIRWVQSPLELYAHATFEPVGDPASASWCMLALFVAIARAGRPIEVRWEPLFPLLAQSLLPDIAAAIPDDRRESVLRAAAERALPKNALLGLFLLWPHYPYEALAEWIEDTLARPAKDTGFAAPHVKRWKVDWSALLAKTPRPAPRARTKPATRTMSELPSRSTASPSKRRSPSSK